MVGNLSSSSTVQAIPQRHLCPSILLLFMLFFFSFCLSLSLSLSFYSFSCSLSFHFASLSPSLSLSQTHIRTKLDLFCSWRGLMNISMGFSCGDDFDTTESKAPLTDEESREARQRIGMDWHHLGVEVDMEFWPVEHPMEPPDEDRPVKCPMPDSSVINDGGVNEKRFSESMRKRTEVPIVVEGQRMVVANAEPPVRAVRKRHHTLTHGDHIITPLMRMPPLPPLPTHNISIFQMLQQFDKFES